MCECVVCGMVCVGGVCVWEVWEVCVCVCVGGVCVCGRGVCVCV